MYNFVQTTSSGVSHISNLFICRYRNDFQNSLSSRLDDYPPFSNTYEEKTETDPEAITTVSGMFAWFFGEFRGCNLKPIATPNFKFETGFLVFFGFFFVQFFRIWVFFRYFFNQYAVFNLNSKFFLF